MTSRVQCFTDFKAFEMFHCEIHFSSPINERYSVKTGFSLPYFTLKNLSNSKFSMTVIESAAQCLCGLVSSVERKQSLIRKALMQIERQQYEIIKSTYHKEALYFKICITHIKWGELGNKWLLTDTFDYFPVIC